MTCYGMVVDNEYGNAAGNITIKEKGIEKSFNYIHEKVRNGADIKKNDKVKITYLKGGGDIEGEIIFISK